jgi:hypothetical protein
LVQEAKNVIDLFPHLRDSYDRDELPLSFIIRRDAGRVTRASAAKRPRRMSAAARRAVSLRMKRYWAARRKTAPKPYAQARPEALPGAHSGSLPSVRLWVGVQRLPGFRTALGRRLRFGQRR